MCCWFSRAEHQEAFQHDGISVNKGWRAAWELWEDRWRENRGMRKKPWSMCCSGRIKPVGGWRGGPDVTCVVQTNLWVIFHHSDQEHGGFSYPKMSWISLIPPPEVAQNTCTFQKCACTDAQLPVCWWPLSASSGSSSTSDHRGLFHGFSRNLWLSTFRRFDFLEP